MEGLLATLETYRLAFAKGARLALRNWPVLASLFAYSFIMWVTTQVAWRLGIAGGFLLALVFSACTGSFLYLVEMIVRTNRVTLEDFKRSFGVYFRDVLAVNFVLWIGSMVVNLAVVGLPQAELVLLFVHILVLVFLNAVPELIYLGHHSAMALLAESYSFISENWIEWFPPNILLFVVLYWIWALPPTGLVMSLLTTSAASLFLYFAMVVRGLLFAELSATSRRGRIFRRRAGR